MTKLFFNADWIYNPSVFDVGTIPPHAQLKNIFGVNEKTLNGRWSLEMLDSMEAAKNAVPALEDDYAKKMPYTIMVPSHLQMQGFLNIQYVNTMYPWDGIDKIVPPQLPQQNNSTAF